MNTVIKEDQTIQDYCFLLNGAWQYSESKNWNSIMSPTNHEEIGRIPVMTQDEMDTAVQGAKQAQVKWSDVPMYERGQILKKWADNIVEKADFISSMIVKEVCKKKSAAIDEVIRTADLIRYTVEEGLRLHGESMRGDSFYGGNKNKVAIIQKVPVGVVLAISPFNYPVNLSAAKIAPALMTGNTVIFKPATQGCISSLLMIEALHDAGLPAGVLNVITGKGSEVGDYLVAHPAINLISFTGGTKTGLRIAQNAVMKGLILELGGKDPAIVLEDANLDLAAKQIVSGAFSYSGQRCTAIKRVLVMDRVADALVAKIKLEVSKLKVGMPEEDADITPLISLKAANYVDELIQDAIDRNGEIIMGNQREGNLIYPTIIDKVTPEMRVAWEEPFGPVLPIIRINDKEDAIRLSNQSEYGLQASVFTESINTFMSLVSKLEVGSVQLNGRTERGPDHFPFLGVKNSGLGVQGVRKSIESMTRDKVAILNL